MFGKQFWNRSSKNFAQKCKIPHLAFTCKTGKKSCEKNLEALIRGLKEREYIKKFWMKSRTIFSNPYLGSDTSSVIVVCDNIAARRKSLREYSRQ